MNINADFSKPASAHGADMPWIASPMPGVERRMLDRVGDEVARATSIVRYAPGSAFSAHVHSGGEEYLVLDGVFQDEHGDFPVGTYVRNPPGSSHTPGAAQGATIFVKLWQFDPEDRTAIVVRTDGATAQPAQGRPGVLTIALHQDARENVRIELWQADAEIVLDGHDGLEVFVMAGGFRHDEEDFRPLSWLRLPVDQPLVARAGEHGAHVWIKSGHLTPESFRPAGPHATGLSKTRAPSP